MGAIPVLVIEGGGAAADHFQAGYLGAPVDEVPVQAGFDSPDIVQPVVQGQVFVDAAQQDHGSVGVHVHEAGNHGLAAEVQLLGTVDAEGLRTDARDTVAVHQDVDGTIVEHEILQEDHRIGRVRKNRHGGVPVSVC